MGICLKITLFSCSLREFEHGAELATQTIPKSESDADYTRKDLLIMTKYPPEERRHHIHSPWTVKLLMLPKKINSTCGITKKRIKVSENYRGTWIWIYISSSCHYIIWGRREWPKMLKRSTCLFLWKSFATVSVKRCDRRKPCCHMKKVFGKCIKCTLLNRNENP